MSRRTGRRMTVFAVVVAAILGTFGVGTATAQVDVRTIEVTGVATCEQLAGQVGSAEAWAGIRIASPRDGTFGNSYATVKVSKFSGSQFDWSTDLGMNAVLISYQESAASPSKQAAYLYSPGAANGSAVGSAEVPVGGTITQITLCHDPSTPTAGLSTNTSVAPTTTTTASQSSTTTTPPSSSTVADSTTTTTELTTTTEPTSTTHLDEAPDELAVTGADSGVLLMIGLVLVMLGAGFTSLLELGRRSSYVRTGQRRR
jgi:hypothetical protein